MSYNYQTQYDSPNYTPAGSARAVYGMDRVIEGITIHWWGDPNQNPSYQGIVNYLCRANGNTSAHFVATGTGRQVACIIAPKDIAWHSGSAWGNSRTIGIELDPRARDEDYDVAAELIADIRSAYGDVPIYWHSYFSATACPGVWNPERLDQLSYTKFSHATDWGKGGDKNPKAPTPDPVPPQTPTTTPDPVLYKLTIDGKQVAAYSTEANAFKGYVQYGSTGIIKHGSKDVTAELIAKYQAPSPTTKDPETGDTLPDTGKPVAEKDGYTEEDRNRDNAMASIVDQIFKLLKSVWGSLTSLHKKVKK